GASVWRDHRVKSEFPAFQDAAISCFSSHTAPKRGSHALSIKSWLNAFTDQADVFSRYVQAVAHDINCLNSDTPTPSSESANIFLEIVGVTQGTRHNPKPRGTAATAQQLDEYSYSIFQEPWAAHLAAVAAAAQQLHRGTPHAVFQVGG